MLLSSVRKTKKPIIVHCSAGIGRTGAIVAIEFILERLQNGISCESMEQILKDLRDQRPYSIQNELVPNFKLLQFVTAIIHWMYQTDYCLYFSNTYLSIVSCYSTSSTNINFSRMMKLSLNNINNSSLITTEWPLDNFNCDILDIQ